MPRRDVRSSLDDAAVACARITEVLLGRELAEYSGDWRLRAIVERQFVILGEALLNAARLDRDVEVMIGEFRRIIDFRNIVVHGYDNLNDETVWEIAREKVPLLTAQLSIILRRLDPDWTIHTE